MMPCFTGTRSCCFSFPSASVRDIPPRFEMGKGLLWSMMMLGLEDEEVREAR